MRFVPVRRTNVMPGDTVTAHADLQLANDTGERVTLIGFEWRPVYAPGEARQLPMSESNVEVTQP